MNILVVGGAGYIGGALTDLLARSKHNFRVYDALLYEESYRKQVDFVYGDIRDKTRLSPQLKWADIVVWLAALVGDGACALNPKISKAINVDTVKWLAQNYDGRIFFISTCSIYGDQDGILDESSQTMPISTYAVTKLSAERYLSNKNAIIFRSGTLFGVGDLFSRIRLDLVLNTLVAQAYQNGRVTIFGGNQFRPILHVNDIANAILDNLFTNVNGIFNIHNQNIRIIDLAYQIQKHFPNLIIEQTEAKFEDARNYRVSSEKAKNILGFKCRHQIDDGIIEIKQLLQSGRIKPIDNPRYNNENYLSTHIKNICKL
jgi:nucleoside-diphosphate-sugar epimerase